MKICLLMVLVVVCGRAFLESEPTDLPSTGKLTAPLQPGLQSAPDSAGTAVIEIIQAPPAQEFSPALDGDRLHELPQKLRDWPIIEGMAPDGPIEMQDGPTVTADGFETALPYEAMPMSAEGYGFLQQDSRGLVETMPPSAPFAMIDAPARLRLASMANEDERLVNGDVPSRWGTLAYGPMRLEVQLPWLSGIPFDAIRIWVDGKQTHPNFLKRDHQEMGQWEGITTQSFFYRWDCPPLGKHHIQVTYLRGDRWSVMSAPVRFEFLEPAAPEIIAIGIDDQSPRPTDHMHAISVSSQIRLKLAGPQPGDSIAIEVDGKQQATGTLDQDCCIAANLKHLFPSGRYKIAVRTVVGEACGLTSKPSAPQWIDLYDHESQLQIDTLNSLTSLKFEVEPVPIPVLAKTPDQFWLPTKACEVVANAQANIDERVSAETSLNPATIPAALNQESPPTTSEDSKPQPVPEKETGKTEPSVIRQCTEGSGMCEAGMLCDRCLQTLIWNSHSGEVDSGESEDLGTLRRQTLATVERSRSLGKRLDALMAHLASLTNEDASLRTSIDQQLQEVEGAVRERLKLMLAVENQGLKVQRELCQLEDLEHIQLEPDSEYSVNLQDTRVARSVKTFQSLENEFKAKVHEQSETQLNRILSELTVDTTHRVIASTLEGANDEPLFLMEVEALFYGEFKSLKLLLEKATRLRHCQVDRMLAEENSVQTLINQTKLRQTHLLSETAAAGKLAEQRLVDPAASELRQQRTIAIHARNGLRELMDSLVQCITQQTERHRIRQAVKQSSSRIADEARLDLKRFEALQDFGDEVVDDLKRAVARWASLQSEIGRKKYRLRLQTEAMAEEHERQLGLDEQNAKLEKNRADSLRDSAELQASLYWKRIEARHATEDALRKHAPPTTTYFHSPAHFPIPRFGTHGLDDAREGMTIAEGMKLITKADGTFEVEYTVLRSALPAKLHLQLHFQTSETSAWNTITLKPQQVRQGVLGLETHSVDDDVIDMDDPRYINFQEIGAHPALKEFGGRITKIRRTGSARFGFGFEGLDVYKRGNLQAAW